MDNIEIFESYKNEYVEIKYDEDNCTIGVKWLPSHEYMSTDEFNYIIWQVFNITELLKVKTAFIDAYDFNYPILKSTIDLIKCHLTTISNVKFKITRSRYLLGNKGISRLIKNIDITKHKLLVREVR